MRIPSHSLTDGLAAPNGFILISTLGRVLLNETSSDDVDDPLYNGRLVASNDVDNFNQISLMVTLDPI